MPRGTRVLRALAVLAVLLFSGVTDAQAPVAAPGIAPQQVAASKPVASSAACLECHKQMAAPGMAIHAPFKNAQCQECHLAVTNVTTGKCGSTVAKAWERKGPDGLLCGQCHKVGGPGKKHKPIADGSCTACHLVHAATTPKLLKTASTELLCLGCHDGFEGKRWVHAPVNKGDCLACHDPHAGRAEPLLADRRDRLCLGCHSPNEAASGRVKHTAVREGQCASCHDPHAGDAPAMVRATGKALCLPCHDAKAPQRPGTASIRYRLDLERGVVHKPVKTGDCQRCHTQKHSSNHPGLLKASVADTCYECHDRFDKDRAYLHSAVKLGDCSVCHEPHSSTVKGLLASEKINALCFKCHEDDVTAQKWVHQPITDSGCTACHDPHGADTPALVQHEGTALCLKCHQGVGVGVAAPHVALDRYGCSVCHDPHGAANPAGLRTGVNSLCVACHPNNYSGAHVGSFGKEHKVTGGPDLRRPGKDFSCVSCHDPHGTDNPKLFRSGSNAQEMCKQCH